jgi:hypothetical protein
MRKTVLTIAALIFCCKAEMHLQGEISSESIDSTGNPYVIEKTIIIPEGKKIVVNEGCVFLFKSYTGIKVFGNLIIKGSQGKNVIFTSYNDNMFNPRSDQAAKPFDWNGIVVAKEADTVKMENFRLLYSSFGIKSLNGKIALKNAIFGSNGQYNFMISDKMQDVKENVPFSYNMTIEKTAGSNETQVKNAVKPKPIDKETLFTPMNVKRYSALTVGAVGAVFGIIYAVKSAQTNRTLGDQNYFIQQAQIQQKPVDEVWNDMHNKWKNETLLRNIFIGIGGLGLSGFTLTLIF